MSALIKRCFPGGNPQVCTNCCPLLLVPKTGDVVSHSLCGGIVTRLYKSIKYLDSSISFARLCFTVCSVLFHTGYYISIGVVAFVQDDLKT